MTIADLSYWMSQQGQDSENVKAFKELNQFVAGSLYNEFLKFPWYEDYRPQIASLLTQSIGYTLIHLASRKLPENPETVELIAGIEKLLQS